MLLILISWIYIALITFIIGIGTSDLLKSHSENFIIQSFTGLFSITILAGFWAVFYRINWEFHLLLLLLGIFILKFKWKTINKSITQLLREFKSLDGLYKTGFLLFFVGILFKSALLPTIFDNETYYVQTIKWLNEYGLVTGLANLHLFLGQTSAWHISQSVFNFSFFTGNLNDLNGFCLLLAVLNSILKLNRLNSKSLTLLTIILLVFSFYFLFFIDSPSPDLPIYIFTIIVSCLFLENYNSFSKEDFFPILILVLFSIFIKPIFIILLILPLYLYLVNYKILKKETFKSAFLILITFSIITLKNFILTGYGFYPNTSFNLYTSVHAVPKNIINYFFSEKMRYSFFIDTNNTHSLTVIDKLKNLLTFSKIIGTINLITFITFILFAFVAVYKKTNRKFVVLYLVLLSQFLLIIIIIPNFRFYIHYTFILLGLLTINLIKDKKQISIVFKSSLIIFILFLGISLKYNFGKNQISKTKSNRYDNLIFIPNNNSSLETTFDLIKSNQFYYYSPKDKSVFWITGSGNLPCVSQEQIEYFKINFNTVPQKKSDDLKKGFISTKNN